MAEPVKYTNEEITRMVERVKPIRPGTLDIDMKRDGKHRRGGVDLLDAKGVEYRIYIRQAILNSSNFSIGLGLKQEGTSTLFVLRRYCGNFKPHYNPIEGERFRDYHIHKATERYQRMKDVQPEKYAERTDKYDSFEGALETLREECNLVFSDQPGIMNLFDQPDEWKE